MDPGSAAHHAASAARCAASGARLPHGLLRRRHAPHGVADIVGDQERALAVYSDADRPALRFALVVEEAGQHVPGLARGLAAREGNEDHLVAGAGFSIPRAVLADKG